MNYFSDIDAALEDFKQGKLLIVVDDEDRENEGDFFVAAEVATPETINFMTKHGRGIVCCPITETRARELEINLLEQNNSSSFETPFATPVDLISPEISTGVSAKDRCATIKALADKDSKPGSFARPGHIFPLIAKEGGVLRRAGHTEACVDLARLAGLAPAAALVEIMNDDGSMARTPELIKIAKQHNLKIITIKDLIQYRRKKENLVKRETEVTLPTEFGTFQLIAYKEIYTENIHLALKKGNWTAEDPVLVRVHSSCITGDILHSLRCDCGDQLAIAMQTIQANEQGLILYMNQEGRGIGLINKLKAYKLQEEGLDTVEANLALGFKKDQRDYGVGAQILYDLDVRKIRLLTNNPKKRIALEGYGLELIENVPIEVKANEHNLTYLKTKKEKMGHSLKLIS